PMVNLSRLPRMQSAKPVFDYPFAALKADPKKALDPQPVLNPLRGGAIRGLLRLPLTMWEMSKSMGALKKAQDGFAEKFASIASTVALGSRAAMGNRWSDFSASDLVVTIETSLAAFLEFASVSLKPTVFAQQAWSSLVQLLTPKLGEERA